MDDGLLHSCLTVCYHKRQQPSVSCCVLVRSSYLELRGILVHPEDLIWCRLQVWVAERLWLYELILLYSLSNHLHTFSLETGLCGYCYMWFPLTAHHINPPQEKLFFLGGGGGGSHLLNNFPVNNSIIGFNVFSHTATVPVCLSLPNLGLE